jgi:hypothetical protein
MSPFSWSIERLLTGETGKILPLTNRIFASIL